MSRCVFRDAITAGDVVELYRVNGEETEMKRNVHWNGSRRGMTLLILLVVIPATIYLCYRAGGRVYYLASVLIILYTMVPFPGFERRKPQARELVVLAVLCAIAVASRAAFKMIDHFKPMTAIIMIPAWPLARRPVFGGRGQRLQQQLPLWPWPMDALADVCLRHGGLSGRALYRLGWLSKKRLPLSLMAFAVLLLVGLLLDTCALFTQTAAINWETAKAIYLSGVPINCIHGVATF